MDLEDKSLYVGRQKGGDSQDYTPIYTVVTAVLSPDMVDELPARRREFLQKLQTDTGVSINLHRGGGTYEVEGSLAQLQQVHDILSELVGNRESPQARLKQTNIPNGLPTEGVQDASGTKPIVAKEVPDKPVSNGTPKSKVSPSGKPRGEKERHKSRNSEDDEGFEIIGETEQEEARGHDHQPAVRPKVRHQRPMAAQFDNHDSLEKKSGASAKSVRERHDEDCSDLSSDDEDVMALDQDTFNYLYHAYQDKLQDIRRQYRVKFRSKSNETDMLKFKVIPKDPTTTLDQLTTAKDAFIALYQSVFPNLVQEVMELAYDPALAQQVKTAIDKTRKDHPDVYVQVENNNHRFAFIGEQVQVIEAKSQFRQLSGVMSGLVRQVGRHHTLGGHIIVPTNLQDEIREQVTRNMGEKIPEDHPYGEEIELQERKTSEASEPGGSRGVRLKQQSDRYVFRTKEGITVSMYQGDLTQEKATAIVNAANGYLAHAAGIAAAIQEQAGPSLEEECRKYISKHGPLYETQVMHTSAGNLPCHYVIHAVGPKWRDYSNKTECASALRVTFLNCLDYANEKLHATTIALPAISTGIFGVPNDVCAKAVYNAVRDFSKSQSQLGSLGEVRLVNAELDMVHVLRQMFEISMSQEEEEEEGCESPSSGSAFIRISKTTEEVLAATSPRAARRREDDRQVEEEDTEVAQITEMAPEEGEDDEPEVEPLEDIQIITGKPKLLHSISDPHGASGGRRNHDKSDVIFTSIPSNKPTDPDPSSDQEPAHPSSDDQIAATAAEAAGPDEDDPEKRPVQFTTKPPPEEGAMSEKEKVIKDLLDNFDKLTDTERGLLDQLLTETDPRSGQSHGVHKPRVRSRSLDRPPKQPPEKEASRTRSPLRSQKAGSTASSQNERSTRDRGKPKDNCLLCNTTEQLRTVPFCKVGHKYCLQCKVKYYSRLRTCPHKDCHEPVTPDFRSATKIASNDAENKQFTSTAQASADPSKGPSTARIHFPSDVEHNPPSQEPTYGTLYPLHESSLPSEQPTNTQSTASSSSNTKSTSNTDGRRRSSDSTSHRSFEPESQSHSSHVPESKTHHGSSYTADPSSFSPRRRVSDSGTSSTDPESASSPRVRSGYSFGERASRQQSQSKKKQRGLIVKSLAEDIDDVGLDSGHSQQRGWDSDTHVHKGRDSENCSICRSTFMNPKTLPSCGHMFCTPCIDRAMQIKPVCPICGEVYGTLWGSQPEGTMEWKADPHLPLPGYERHGTIVVMYDFPDGIQTSSHANPGRRYYGCHRRAYLPNTAEGQEVCRLLHKAFQAKLLFTVGQSVTTGMDNCVILNDIHHKTNTHGGPTNHGYPDPDYLRRVKEELAVKGITTL